MYLYAMLTNSPPFKGVVLLRRRADLHYKQNKYKYSTHQQLDKLTIQRFNDSTIKANH